MIYNVTGVAQVVGAAAAAAAARAAMVMKARNGMVRTPFRDVSLLLSIRTALDT